ncbi:MAG TPA: ACT domain-containing protein [Bryobacteraceae bacterium]|nr:ACT domain-containing protein [Bryobacteraceae bacterium]
MTIAGNRLSSALPERIRQEFLSTGDAVRALAERTALVDRQILESAAMRLLPAVPDGLALLAVGGYGRRHLFPYSDIDLLLLVESEKLAHASREAISAFLQSLWDAGLRMSHSVRTPAECAELHDHDIELNVSLLDQRFLGGDRVLYAELAQRLPRFLQAQREALARNLARLARERHEKYQDTFYHLEPNLKESPGGLRDYQLLRWLEQLKQGGAGREASARLDPAWQFLARVRCHLHYLAGRDDNRLTFDAQDALAEVWGSRDTAGWMREYFRHTSGIYRVAVRALETSEAQTSSLFSQFRDWRSRLSNTDFTVSRERVHFRAPQQLDADPELLLRLFTFVARHGVRISLEAEERIATRLPRLAAYFAQSRPVWPAFEEILSLPYAPLALRAMHESGALLAVWPELESIDCLVIRDFYHRYTVDEHTLVAIQALAELARPADPARRRYAELLLELERPALLRFALLFHDAGKGDPGHSHVEGSLRLAAQAMDRIQMPQADRETVRFLIRHHLELSATMHARDPYDPATAQYLAGRVGTVERLKALTLVTYADISAVYPGAMTPWRAEQLWQLYLLTYNELTRELETERIGAAVVESAELSPFLEGFPTRYLRTHSGADMEAHLGLESASRTRGVAVDLKHNDSAWVLTLVTGDRPGLFASAAGTLSSFGMNILKAEAFANRRGTVLDTFTFADPARTLELNPSEIDRLRTTLELVILGKRDVKQLLRDRPKAVPPSRKARVAATVSFDSEASRTATLIQIVAQDRPGLLYDLASAISARGCNIEVVLIDTEAHKAIDVFYVTSGGRKLEPEAEEKLAQSLREACRNPA